jgi:hypothetical protein
MEWRWLDELFSALLGYPSDVLKENKPSSFSRISSWTSPSRWSNISSITSRRPHSSTLEVTGRNEERILGTFSNVIEEEKSQQLSSTSPLSGTHSHNRFSSIIDKAETNSISHLSRPTSTLSVREHVDDEDDVHSLSYSEREWLKGVLNLGKRVDQVRSWIEKIYEMKRRVWIGEHNGT